MRATAKRQKTKYTPPEVGGRYGVDPGKVIHWIKTGQLRAINAARDPNGRPRYLVDIVDLLDFERQRAVTPPEPPAPRRRKAVANSLLVGPDYV